jgi:GNAT superfamily N-acetyltransferase
MNSIKIREYQPGDFDSVTILWRIAREKSVPDFQRTKGYFFYQDQEYFQNRILRDNTVWVAVMEGIPIGFMAIKNDFIDQLYIHPGFQRRGIGTRLLDFARITSPDHLWLYTLQVNASARTFYEEQGFVPEKFGTSPPPENEPDVEYHWRRS